MKLSRKIFYLRKNIELFRLSGKKLNPLGKQLPTFGKNWIYASRDHGSSRRQQFLRINLDVLRPQECCGGRCRGWLEDPMQWLLLKRCRRQQWTLRFPYSQISSAYFLSFWNIFLRAASRSGGLIDFCCGRCCGCFGDSFCGDSCGHREYNFHSAPSQSSLLPFLGKTIGAQKRQEDTKAGRQTGTKADKKAGRRQKKAERQASESTQHNR